jgi:hypothetical protein
MTDHELLPCPFCGESDDLTVVEVAPRVECSCGSLGPECDIESDAVDAWNSRTYHVAPSMPRGESPDPITIWRVSDD